MQRHEWLEENLPDICPKSLSAYTKAQNTKSKKYVSLKEEAFKLGMTLNEVLSYDSLNNENLEKEKNNTNGLLVEIMGNSSKGEK